MLVHVQPLKQLDGARGFGFRFSSSLGFSSSLCLSSSLGFSSSLGVRFSTQAVI